jgi:hypothetical protein
MIIDETDRIATSLLASFDAGTNITLTSVTIAGDKKIRISTTGVPTGSGTTDTIAKWTAPTVLGDSIIAESGSLVTITGDLALTSTDGIDINPGSDVDADLITVGVTGAPTLYWDESEHGLAFSTTTNADFILNAAAGSDTRLRFYENSVEKARIMFDTAPTEMLFVAFPTGADVVQGWLTDGEIKIYNQGETNPSVAANTFSMWASDASGAGTCSFFLETEDSTTITLATTSLMTNLTLSGNLLLGATTAVSGILDEDDLTSNSATDLATQQSIKSYVDSSVNVIIDYFFNDTASDIGGIYYDQTNNDLGGGESTLSTAGLSASTNDQALVNFATLSGEPGILSVPAGIFNVHFHAERTAGSSSVNIYAEIHKRASGGAETLITTTEISTAVTSKASFSIHGSTGVDTDLLVTDRIVIKFYANCGAGSGATVALYQEGTTTSHMSIPSTVDVLNQIFLRTDGANSMSGDLHILDTNGLIVGHSTQVAFAEVTSEAQVLGTTETDASLAIGLFSTTNALSPKIKFLKSGNASLGGNTIVANNEELAGIQVYAADGVDLDTLVSEIQFNVDNSFVAVGAIGGEIILKTATSGGVITDAITINSTQDVTINNGGLIVVDGRFQTAKGGDIASANETTLGTDGNYFDITGNTTINWITKTGWTAGDIIVLQFDSTPQVTDTAGAPPPTGAEIILLGGANFTAAVGDTLTFSYDGTYFREISRTGTLDAGVSAATTSLAGKVELATTAEINTGTDATRAMTPDAFAASNMGKKVLEVVIVGTDTAVGTTTVGVDDIPFIAIPAEFNGWVIVDYYAFHYAAGSGAGTTDVELIRRRAAANVDVMSTPVTTDAEMYANDGVINGANDDVATGDRLIPYVSAIEATPPEGLTVAIIIEKIT